MMTLQELKQSVETAAPGQKIPTAKNIRESGVAVAKEKLDGDTEITAYRNGYAVGWRIKFIYYRRFTAN